MRRLLLLVPVVVILLVGVIVYNLFLAPVAVTCTSRTETAIKCNEENLAKALNDVGLLHRDYYVYNSYKRITDPITKKLVKTPDIKKIRPQKIEIIFTNERYKWFEGMIQNSNIVFSSNLEISGKTLRIYMGMGNELFDKNTHERNTKLYLNLLYTTLIRSTEKAYVLGEKKVDENLIKKNILHLHNLQNQYVFFE